MLKSDFLIPHISHSFTEKAMLKAKKTIKTVTFIQRTLNNFTFLALKLCPKEFLFI